MRSLIKYLFPLLMALAFWNCTDGSAAAVSEDSSNAVSFIYNESDSDISETKSEFCLPRQVSFASVYRVHVSSRRTGGVHKNNIEFVKSGKVINADLSYINQRKSIIIHSSKMEPAFRLLSLGKLII